LKPPSHRIVTEVAFDLLNEMKISFPYPEQKREIANESEITDYYMDLEFVDVRGRGRDNPHEDEKWTVDDKPHRRARVLEEDYYFTSFNHYIDIKKGPGLFDDYDGYSYRFGSASKDEYQEAGDAALDSRVQLLSKIVRALGVSVKVDQSINWWFNDEYVHAPGQDWYKGCSPSVTRYSFFGDKGIYASIEEEAKNRFPLANSVGKEGMGIPYSVFMPVDNMARFHFNSFLAEREPKHLGPVMHAIQDASIPHHAAGLCGNWHGKYEKELDDRLLVWTNDPRFVKETKLLFSQWWTADDTPPQWLGSVDRDKVPHINWKIETLVTWIALNAYNEYEAVFNHFRNGYMNDEQSMKKLTKETTAMSMLVLCKAIGHKSNSHCVR
jgi:hypothetical protein